MHENAAVADKVMACFALGLGLPEDFFKEEIDPRPATILDFC